MSNQIDIKVKAAYEGDSDIKRLRTDLKSLNKIKSLEGLTKDFAATNKEFVAAKQKVRELAKAMKDGGGKQLKKDHAAARLEVSKLSRTLEKQRTSLRSMSADAKKAGIAVNDLAASQKKLKQSTSKQALLAGARGALDVRSFRDVKSEIKSLNRAYSELKRNGKLSMAELAVAKDRLRQKTAKLNQEMKKSHGILAKSKKHYTGVRSAAASLSVLFAGFSATLFVKSIFDAGVSAQQLSMAFKAIYGDGEKARQELVYLKDVSTELGLNFEKTANSYKGIAAASRGTVMEGANTRKIFLAIAEASTALGLSADNTSGSLYAISQMISKGKITAEELRQQLGERLPGAFNLMAEAAGVTTAQLDKMLQNGEVGINTLIKFADILHGKYGDAAQEASKNAVASVNRLQTAWYDLRVEMANSGFLDQATDYMTGIANALKDPQVRQSAVELVRHLLVITDGMIRAGFAIKAVFEFAAQAWSITLGAVTRYLTVLTKLTDLLGITTNATREMKAISEAWFQSAGDLGQKSIGSFKIMANGFHSTNKEAQKTESVVKKTFESASNAAEKSAGVQVKVTDKALKKMRKDYEKYVEKIKDLQNEIGENQRSLNAELRDMARSGMSDIKAWRDRKKEAKEYYADAKRAIAAGKQALADGNHESAAEQFKIAKQFANEAKSAYKDLNEEVKSGDKVLISQRSALKTSMAGVKQSGELAVKALEAQQQAAMEAADALNNESGWKLSTQALTEAGEKAKDLASASKDFSDDWQTAFINMGEEAGAQIDAIERNLKDLTARKHQVIVEIKEVIKKSHGGLVGSKPKGFQSGGLLNFLGGGYLPGYGGGDRRHIIGEDGEVMIKKESVRAAGLRAALAFNSGQFNVVISELKKRVASNHQSMKMNMGGLVKRPSIVLPDLQPLNMQNGGVVAGGGGSGQTINVNFNLPGSGPPIQGVFDKKNTAELLRQADRMKRFRS